MIKKKGGKENETRLIMKQRRKEKKFGGEYMSERKSGPLNKTCERSKYGEEVTCPLRPSDLMGSAKKQRDCKDAVTPRLFVSSGLFPESKFSHDNHSETS